jgi:cell wall-associated NlpC family hydrolase
MDNHVRTAYLNSLIGTPYRKNAKGPDAYDCWHLAVTVEDRMFGRVAPTVVVPANADWSWMIEQFTSHPELGNWVELLQPNNGLINASDGAIVLMARTKQPAHCGVYLERERKILHADERDGVVLQDIPTLRAQSWSRLRFYEPR